MRCFLRARTCLWVIGVCVLSGECDGMATTMAPFPRGHNQLLEFVSGPSSPLPSEPLPSLSKKRSLSITPNHRSASVIFHSGYIDFLNGRYAIAISAFRQFITDFPSTSLVDQAYYYLAESYYYSRQHESAARTFMKLLADFPKSRYGPSALFKLGVIMADVGKVEKAHQVWALVVKTFPRSPEARLAQQKLRKAP